jgi:hypothetical protein
MPISRLQPRRRFQGTGTPSATSQPQGAPWLQRLAIILRLTCSHPKENLSWPRSRWIGDRPGMRVRRTHQTCLTCGTELPYHGELVTNR